MRGGKLFTYSIIYLINFLVLILFTFNPDNIFLKELFFIAVTLLLAFIILIGTFREAKWANSLSAFFFAINLLNVIYLYFHIKAYLLILLLVINIIGFLLSLGGSAQEDEEEDDFSRESRLDRELRDVDIETPKIIIEEDENRFVASKEGTTYYPADSAGAKRIKEDNKVYFDSEEEAKAAGYKVVE